MFGRNVIDKTEYNLKYYAHRFPGHTITKILKFNENGFFFSRNGKFIETGNRFWFPDVVTIGYIIGKILFILHNFILIFRLINKYKILI